MTTEARVQMQVRLTPSTVDRLRAEADRRIVSVAYLTEAILAAWLDALPPTEGPR